MITLPITYDPRAGSISDLCGALWADVAPFYGPEDPIRQIERASIRTWMEQNREHLTGRVLDFGAGKQPYQDLVSGEYVPYERGGHIDDGVNSFDAVMCNQVLQYIPRPECVLSDFRNLVLRRGGHLLLTYPTNWPEVEREDLWRFTAEGMAKLVWESGFDVLKNELRAQISLGHFKLALGYGMLARKR